MEKNGDVPYVVMYIPVKLHLKNAHFAKFLQKNL